MAATVTEYEKALKTLRIALDAAASETDHERFLIARDATIQRFEFCVELAWKTAVKRLGSSSVTAKPAIREMASQGLISDPAVWFEFVEARNKSSHTYKEEIAAEVFAVARRFYDEGERLCRRLLEP